MDTQNGGEITVGPSEFRETAEAEVGQYGSVATGTIFDFLPAELQLVPTTSVTRFSIEHWLYLASTYPTQVPAAPVQLAPFPAAVHSEKQLHEQLRAWGYLAPEGGPSPELVTLLEKIAHPIVALWGQVRFPQQQFTARLDLPPEALGWGISAEQEVVPRVPFLVAWGIDEIVLVTSHEEGLVVASVAPSHGDAEDFDSISADLAAAWGAIVDPSSEWPSTTSSRVRIPRWIAEELAASPVLGQRVEGITPDAARVEVAQMMSKSPERFADYRMPVNRVVELIAREEVACAQAVVTTFSHRSKEAATSENAVSMILGRNLHGEPESYIIYPESWGHDTLVTYDKNTPEQLRNAISYLLRTTAL